MTRPDDVEWRRREELRSLLTALRSRRGENSGKRLRQDDAAILSGLSTRRYAALERGTVENPSLDLIENVASGLRMTLPSEAPSTCCPGARIRLCRLPRRAGNGRRSTRASAS